VSLAIDSSDGFAAVGDIGGVELDHAALPQLRRLSINPPRDLSRSVMEILLIIVILLFVFGGWRFTRR
jgi:hypothetical protein